jgi:hypothetical protein
MKTITISLGIAILGYTTLSFIGLSETESISKYKSSPPRSGGPAEFLGADKTGSPLSTSTCTLCHGPSNANTTTTIQVKDMSNTPITQYTPGDTYTIEVTVNNGSMTEFGMQMVALTSANNQAGTISTPSSNAQIFNLSGVQYLEHNSTTNGAGSAIYTSMWMAPATGSGMLTLYGVSIGVNGNGNTSGDQTSSPINMQLTELIPTTIDYSNTNFCDNSTNETPTITGTTGGVFSSTPVGLALNPSTGEIDFTTSTPNSYTITYTTATEIATATLEVNITYNTADATTICDGDIYTFGTQTLNSNDAGLNSETFQSISGCDSVVTLTLSVINPITSNISATLCSGDTFNFGSQILDASNSGLNTLTLDNAAANGCDSIVNLTLTVINPVINDITATICDGDTYDFGTQVLDASNAGLNTLTLENAAANGCDSIINLTLSATSIDNSISVINNSFMSNQNGATYQWIECPAMTPLADSTNQSIIIGSSLIDFSYGAIITLNGCSDTSDCLTVLNIQDNITQNKLSVYPNPSQNQIQIGGLENYNSIKSITVTSINGKHIKTLPINSIIEITELKKGVYIINVIHETGVEQLRFIKN